MKRRTLGLGLALAVLPGCYLSHERPRPSEPTPSPCDDPAFDEHALEHLAFDSRGVPVGEPFWDERFESFIGFGASMSDDGRWLLTYALQPHPGGDFVSILYDLPARTRTELPLGWLSTHLSISGDGSTLFQFRPHLSVTDGLWTFVAIDRATLEARDVLQGVLVAAGISDDASRAVIWIPDPTVPYGFDAIRVDMSTGARARVERPTGAISVPGVLAGDGETLTYWSFAEATDAAPVSMVVLGPGGDASQLTSVAGASAISDDGCELIAERSPIGYWGFGGGEPILNLAVFVGGRRISTGPEGEANIPVSALALSGDGGTAVIAVGAITADDQVLARIRLADGRVETQRLGCNVNGIAVADDGSVIAVDVFRCDGAIEPHEHTRVFRPGVW